MARAVAQIVVASFACVILNAQIDGTAQTNVEYARAGEISLRLDAYPTAAGRPAPAVILVHGGAWVKGDRRNMAPLIRPLTEAGFAVFNISYRLAPAYLYPAAVEDVREAVRFVRSHAERFHIDPDRVALLGESAGAQLVSLAVLDDGGDVTVQAVVSVSGPTDFARLAQTSTAVPEALRQAARDSGWGAFVIAGLQRMSPMTYVRPGVPPFLFVHGTEDPVVPIEQSTQMCDAIRRAGGVCEVQAVEGGDHGLRGWDDDPQRAVYKSALVQWLTKVLAPGS